MLRVVFMGSPEFAVPSLRVALARCQVEAVVSQPDRPAGRGRALASPPVVLAARAAGVPILQPPGVRRAEVQEALRELGADVFVVVAYGRILPREVLAIPRLGCINVHASLLPRYRGAAPIQWAILQGERETGVSIMQLDEGMDTGPVLLRRTEPIRDEDTAGSLAERLAATGAEALAEALAGIESGALRAVPQDAAAATYAPLLTKEDGRIDFGRSVSAVRDRVRGVDPWPGAFTLLDGAMLKVFRPRLAAGRPGAVSGEVLGLAQDGLVVACAEGGAVALGELQLPGRKRLPAAAVCAGRPIPAGTRLGG